MTKVYFPARFSIVEVNLTKKRFKEDKAGAPKEVIWSCQAVGDLLEIRSAKKELLFVIRKEGPRHLPNYQILHGANGAILREGTDLQALLSTVES